MLDEEINRKIKEAADQYHPEYDDTAWNKMEQLLDEHLPQKKSGRRILLILPLALLLVTWLFFIALHKEAKNSSGISQKTEIQKAPGKSPSFIPPSANTAAEAIAPHSSTVPNGNILSPEKNRDKIKETILNRRNVKSNKLNQVSGNESLPKNRDLDFKESLQSQQEKLPVQNVVPDNKIKMNEPAFSPENENSGKRNEVNAGKKDNNTDTKKIDKEIVKNNAQLSEPAHHEKKGNLKNTTGKKKAKDNMSSRFSNNFGITFSAGPGSNSIHVNNAGKMTMTYGAGVSYSISPVFTLRTGFYTTKKIYSVGPDDYHFPDGGNYEYIEDIGANCAVYEIPITLSYSFGKVKKHNWFASTGLSSLLMKRESYDYRYKLPNGQRYNKNWTIENENKHFLSVLDISAGYQYNLSKRISLTVEPYVNIPLGGIGVGKVKLNSGGILFTLIAKPFLKANGKKTRP